jgi:hypothetical protein
MSHFYRTFIAVATVAILAGPAAARPVCYFGECGPEAIAPAPAVPKAQPASTDRVLFKYGSWEVDLIDGQRVLVDRFDDGTAVMITEMDGEFDLMIYRRQWNLSEGRSFAANANVDGRVFRGTARAIDRQMVVIKGMTMSFMKALYHGKTAVITVLGQEWQLGLANAAKAIDAAAGLEPASE